MNNEEFEGAGRVWFRDALPAPDLELLHAAFPQEEQAGGRICLSAFQSTLENMPNLKAIVDKFGSGYRPVRVVSFNKSGRGNWSVPWHQDRVIAVDKRRETAGYSNWSQKSGAWHCEPPLHVLEDMLFVRIHLDSCDEDNGAMEIAKGSHKLGKVDATDAATSAAQHPLEYCRANAGDVVVLKMLTLHRSSSSRNQTPRRVLRVDYSREPLDSPLEWT